MASVNINGQNYDVKSLDNYVLYRVWNEATTKKERSAAMKEINRRKRSGNMSDGGSSGAFEHQRMGGHFPKSSYAVAKLTKRGDKQYSVIVNLRNASGREYHVGGSDFTSNSKKAAREYSKKLAENVRDEYGVAKAILEDKT